MLDMTLATPRPLELGSPACRPLLKMCSPRERMVFRLGKSTTAVLKVNVITTFSIVGARSENLSFVQSDVIDVDLAWGLDLQLYFRDRGS